MPTSPSSEDSNNQALEDYVASFFGASAEDGTSAILPEVSSDVPSDAVEEPNAQQASDCLGSSSATQQVKSKITTSLQVDHTPRADEKLNKDVYGGMRPSEDKKLLLPNELVPADLAPKPLKPQLPSTALPTFLAESIPADIPLAATQKRQLQKLLDATVNVASAIPVTAPTPRPLAEAETLTGSAEPIPPAPEVTTGTREALLSVQDLAKETSSLSSSGLTKSTASKKIEAQSIKSKGSEEGHHECSLDNSIAKPNFRAHWQEKLPDWATHKFDALLLSCRGVTLAIPLIHLAHIYLQAEPLNQLPGLPSWALGVKPLPQGQLNIIDAGAYFMPEREGELIDNGDYPIISITDTKWAFAVDSVANPVAVKPEDVQWRSLNPDNPWLAGAIKQHMCVLIDPPALIAQLNAQSAG